MAYRNRGTQYDTNPFAQLQPLPYISQRVDEGFINDKLSALQLIEQQRQQSLADSDAISLALGNIEATGDNAKAKLGEIETKLRGELDSFGGGKYGFADPNMRDKLRRVAKDFYTNKDLKHITNFTDAAKADALKRQDAIQNGKFLMNIGDTSNDAFDEEGNQRNFQSGWVVDPGVDEARQKAITQGFNDVVSTMNLAELNAQALTSGDPFLAKNTVTSNRQAIDDKFNEVFDMYYNSNEGQLEKQNIMYENGYENEADAIADMQDRFKNDAIALSKTNKEYGLIGNVAFDKDANPTSIATNLSKSHSTSLQNTNKGITSITNPYYEVSSEGYNNVKVKGESPINDAKRSMYTAWVRAGGQQKLEEALSTLMDLPIDQEEIKIEPGFWKSVGTILSQISTPLSFAQQSGTSAEDYLQTMEGYKKSLEDKDVNLNEVVNEMVSNGDFNEAKAVLETSLDQIFEDIYGKAETRNIKGVRSIQNGDRSGYNERAKPFEDALGQIEKVENDLNSFYEYQSEAFTADLASTPVYQFGDIEGNNKAETAINRRIKNIVPRKFNWFDEYGEKIENENKIPNKVTGLIKVGNTVALTVTVGSGDNVESRIITTDDPDVLNQMNQISGSYAIESAIDNMGNQIVEGDYYWKGNKKEKLPKGYTFESHIGEDGLIYFRLKNTDKNTYEIIDSQTPDGRAFQTDQLRPQDAYLFLDAILD